mmetsp:Transcript_21950/g.24304  ORF Transcript_21950/g.24304 Transcript_21950/m.24304 type:complete len:631 (+) Transcript_21950:56-1948(+)
MSLKDKYTNGIMDNSDNDIKFNADDDIESSSLQKKKEESNNIFSINRQPKNLTWYNVNMSIDIKSKNKDENKKMILNNVWGEAKGGELSAIMGSSGAGKTSLFNVLTGRVRSSSKISVGGDIYLGDEKLISQKKNFGFVSQEDSLHASSTPRQALCFSARLRLPRSTAYHEIDTIVDMYLKELGLVSCADTMIGSTLRKGISGGEKRRVSIGIELITQPSILFLDEPTSGLDSYAAQQVMKLLRNIATNSNATILFTIHQPSSVLFQSFDKLILLHKGRLMYTGSNVNTDFSTNGYPVPPNYNPGDWILDVAQTNEISDLTKGGFFLECDDTITTTTNNDKTTSKNNNKNEEVPSNKATASLWTQLVLLSQREKTSMIKNPTPMLINVFITSFLSLIFGLLFYQIGNRERSNPAIVMAIVGAMINVNISTMMGQSQTALITFSSERPLFLREYNTNHYSVITYFVSHLLTECIQCLAAMLVQALLVYFMIGFSGQTFFEFLAITFTLAMTSTGISVLLGACFGDEKAASATFTLAVVPQFYFSGIFIAISLLPEWIRWAQYLCSLTYASRLSYAYEFGKCATNGEANCQLVLDNNDVRIDDIWFYWTMLVVLFCFFRLTAILILKQRSQY